MSCFIVALSLAEVMVLCHTLIENPWVSVQFTLASKILKRFIHIGLQRCIKNHILIGNGMP